MRSRSTSISSSSGAGTGTDGEPLPGPFSPSRLVVATHLLTAVAVVSLLWLVYRAGDVPQMASLALLAVLVLAAGVPAARIAERREP